MFTAVVESDALHEDSKNCMYWHVSSVVDLHDLMARSFFMMSKQRSEAQGGRLGMNSWQYVETRYLCKQCCFFVCYAGVFLSCGHVC